jgi:hypothetical protein
MLRNTKDGGCLRIRMQKRIFGDKREVITGIIKWQQNKQPHNFVLSAKHKDELIEETAMRC